MEMIVCIGCGKQTPDDGTLCEHCGARIGKKTIDEQSQASELKRYRKCPMGHKDEVDEVHCRAENCGRELSKYIYTTCNKCGSEIHDGTELCKSCAAPEKTLDGEKADEPAQPPPLRPRLILASNQSIEIEIKDGDVVGDANKESASLICHNDNYIDIAFLKNKYISGKHASFSCQNGAWFICDEGSTNGTKVGLRPITPHEKVQVKSDEKIVLADELFIFRVS
jgi:hypothetical protein